MERLRPNWMGGAGILTFCLGASGVGAQESQDSSDDPLEEVIVTGYRESLEVSLDAKRDSVNFTDSISAEDVGKLPDNNLAEALQRVPGVQISRTNGEGQQLSLRGMGPSFTRVLLDGLPISAASEGSVDQQANNREFDFDLLPSEIFSMLQVSKTPRASVVEGGLSGTVDLRTPRSATSAAPVSIGSISGISARSCRSITASPSIIPPVTTAGSSPISTPSARSWIRMRSMPTRTSTTRIPAASKRTTCPHTSRATPRSNWESLEALNLTDEEEYSFYGYENRTNTLNRPGRQFILGIRGQF